MPTAIIGIGRIGSSIAKELVAGGEEVVLASSDPDRTKDLADELGSRAGSAANNREAVEAAATVVLALQLDAMRTVIDEVADLLPGKVVIETSNPMTFDSQGTMSRTLPAGQTSAQMIDSLLPIDVHFAKAFGTFPADVLVSSSNRSPDRAVLFYVAVDTEAGEEVERLIRIAGFEPVGAGGLSSAGRIEVGGDLNGPVVGRGEALVLVATS